MQGVQRQVMPDYDPLPVSATGSSGRSAQPATAHKARVRSKGARMSINIQTIVGNMEQARDKRHKVPEYGLHGRADMEAPRSAQLLRQSAQQCFLHGVRRCTERPQKGLGRGLPSAARA